MAITRSTPKGTRVSHSTSGHGTTAEIVWRDGTVDISYDNGVLGMDVSISDLDLIAVCPECHDSPGMGSPCAVCGNTGYVTAEFSVVAMDASGGNPQPAQALTFDEIVEVSQCGDEYMQVVCGQLGVGKSARFGGGAQPLLEITRVAVR